MSTSRTRIRVRMATSTMVALVLTVSLGVSPVGMAPAPAAEPSSVSAPLSEPRPPASWRQTAPLSVAGTVALRPSRAVSARQAVRARQARFTAFTLTSRKTRDMRGVERSLYRGKFYTQASEDKRLCVVRRESEGFYNVVNPGGNYFGAYQVSRSLARGATWMMLKEHKKLMGKKHAKRVLARLRSKPMNTWPRYWQDAAFHTVINWNGPLSGASHWAGGRWHC